MKVAWYFGIRFGQDGSIFYGGEANLKFIKSKLINCSKDLDEYCATLDMILTSKEMDEKVSQDPLM